CVVEAARETLFEFSHLLPHCVRSREGIRARQLIDSNRSRGFSAKLAIDCVVASRQFDPRDIAHASDLSVGASFNDNITELFFVREAALRTDRVLKCGCAL